MSVTCKAIYNCDMVSSMADFEVFEEFPYVE